MQLMDYEKQVVDKEKIKAIVQLNRLKITKVSDQENLSLCLKPCNSLSISS